MGDKNAEKDAVKVEPPKDAKGPVTTPNKSSDRKEEPVKKTPNSTYEKKDYKRDNYNNNRQNRSLDNSHYPSYGVNPVTGKKERKFTNRCRLFVGNLGNTEEEEFKAMFNRFGEMSEVFINKEKGFGFIRLDTRINAETAKNNLDGQPHKGRTLRVRFASHATALKVHNLGPLVSNELLEKAFTMFGDVERAVVVCDDRGRSKGYGIVEFARKQGATQALQRVNESCFILGRAPRPVTCKPLEQEDDEDGIIEKSLERAPGYHKDREVTPHMAQPGTFEFEWAQRWKALDEMEKGQRESLDTQFTEARDKLTKEMEHAIQEHEASIVRQEILRRQEEVRRQEELRRQEDCMRQEIMRQQEEMRRRDEIRIQEELRRREEIRRQEDILYRQQQEEMIKRREHEMMLRQESLRSGFNTPSSSPLPPKGPGDWGRPTLGPHGPSRGPGPYQPGILGSGPPRMGPGGHLPPPGGHHPPPGPQRPPPVRVDIERERARERADRDRLAARDSRDYEIKRPRRM